MKFKLLKSELTEWDSKAAAILEPECVIRWVSTAIICEVNNGVLPIILEAIPTILYEDVEVFSATIQTKAILTFEKNEEPINDIIKMWKEGYKQEVALFRKAGKGTIIEFLELEDVEHRPDAEFRGAYNLRDAAIKRNLVKPPQSSI